MARPINSRIICIFASSRISRFRSCSRTVVRLQRELTVLVGENNGGKSNIIDAIRLITAPLNGRRERYAEDSDLRYKADPPSFEIVADYAGLSDTLKGLLITAVPDPTKDQALFGCRYEPQGRGGTRGLFTSWAGKFDSTEPEGGSTGLIRHVYLPALRDAQYAMGSASATRVLSLLRHFLPDEEKEQFLQSVSRGEATSDVLGRMNTDITSALEELTGGVRPQAARVNFGNETIQDVARDLRFKLGDSGARLDDIRSSGLGYANLLYMATVVVELTKAKDADLTLFLVEEPEAHLHPQLQRLVLEFLLEKARKSFETDQGLGQPEGRIQVIVSTHSAKSDGVGIAEAFGRRPFLQGPRFGPHAKRLRTDCSAGNGRRGGWQDRSLFGCDAISSSLRQQSSARRGNRGGPPPSPIRAPLRSKR